MGSFTDAIAGWSDDTVEGFHRTIFLAIDYVGMRAIKLSPVLTGQFADNWFYGLETPDTRTHGPTGARAINNLEERPGKPGGFRHFITNALPYGPALERGSSTQAPQGMVGIISIEWPQILDAAARKATT